MNAMVQRALVIVILVGAFAEHGVFSYGDDLKKKQSQLEQLRQEIDRYEKQITDREKKEKATLDLLGTYDRQATLYRRLIKKLHDQEVVLQSDIKTTRQTMNDLGNQLTFLKKQYARYAATAYKTSRTYDLELLLASRSFNQMLIRSEYLKRFSEQRKKDFARITDQHTAMEEQEILLQKQLAEQQSLLAEKQREENKLITKSKKRKQILAIIRKDKKNFKKELDRKKQDVKELEQLIAKLIEEERVKSERKDRVREPATTGTFQSKRGRLHWPVAQGKLTARFGNQEHPTLHTITQNTGIDIAVPAGTNVEAVADGEVAKIFWLPSFGNLVILNHNNGYRTVYAHLSEIAVEEGDAVREGNLLGKSGESLGGSVLHFEIYKDRDKLDPEQWLRSRGVSQR
jgi:murein hydrolase activator